MLALFLTAFLACNSDTTETTKKETTKKINDTIKTSKKELEKAKKTIDETKQTLEAQTTEVKEFVEKSVNTSEAEQMFLFAFLFACTEDHFRIDSGILTIEACISIAPEGDCIRKKDKAIRSRSETK